MAKEKVKVEDKDWEATLTRIDKTYGKGSVMKLGSKIQGDYKIIPTKSLAFNRALGIGGFALGRMYEMQGWEGTGKTTICGELVANAQKAFPDRKVVYIDSEHALDLNYLKALGVNTDEIYLNQPYTCQEGLNIASDLIETGEVSLVIIDSDTGLKPESEVEGDFGNPSLGKKAWLNGQAYPILKHTIHKYNTCMVIISQFREKPGVMYGSPVVTTGGHALKFTADVIMVVSKTVLKEDDQQYGNETKIKITKNKMAPPFISCKFNINYGEGTDQLGEIIDLAIETEVVQKSGSWFSYGESKIGQGFDSVKQFLLDNSELKDEIITKVKEKLC